MSKKSQPGECITRRAALKSSLVLGAAALGATAVVLNRDQRAEGFVSANDRPRVGAIGTGSRWYQKATGLNGRYGSAPDFRRYGDYVAVCDADAYRRDLASGIVKEWTGNVPVNVADYRAILDRKDIDIVHISTL